MSFKAFKLYLNGKLIESLVGTHTYEIEAGDNILLEITAEGYKGIQTWQKLTAGEIVGEYTLHLEAL